MPSATTKVVPANIAQDASDVAQQAAAGLGDAADKLQDVTGVKATRKAMSRMQIKMRTSKHFQKVVVAVTLFGVFVDLVGSAMVSPALPALCSYAEGGPYWSIMAVSEEEALAMGYDSLDTFRTQTIAKRITPHAFKGPKGAWDGSPPFKFSMAMNFIVFISQVGSAAVRAAASSDPRFDWQHTVARPAAHPRAAARACRFGRARWFLDGCVTRSAPRSRCKSAWRWASSATCSCAPRPAPSTRLAWAARRSKRPANHIFAPAERAGPHALSPIPPPHRYAGGIWFKSYYLFGIGLLWNNFFGNTVGVASVYFGQIFYDRPTERDLCVPRRPAVTCVQHARAAGRARVP